MRELDPLEIDVLVLGGGAAGLMAASVLADEGKSVAVVSRSATATALSTGCISFVRSDVFRERGAKVDLETLAHSVHPFSDLFDGASSTLEEIILDMSAFLVRALVDEGLEMSADVFTYHRLLTNLGTSYNCSLAPLHTAAGELDELERSGLVFLGFRGHPDLDPDLAAHIVSSDRRLKSPSSHWAKLKTFKGRTELTVTEAAEILRSEAAKEEVAKVISDLSEENVAVPPLFRLAHFEKGMRWLRKATGRNVFELVTPLSLPGQRLQEGLEKHAASEGCILLQDRELTGLRFEGNRVVEATVVSRTREQRMRFNALIVASGDVIGGGLSLEGLEVRDPLSAFKVGKVKKSRVGVRGIELKALETVETGLLAGNDTRLISKEGVHMQNAFGAGSVLAGFSYPTGVGLGGSLITAWVAARTAKEVA
ncbi:MAG: FAD-binding protein [Methanomassiliicoccales archaeon]|nr:FAD-binding protein [Methanomassiliicoccales archaeon]